MPHVLSVRLLKFFLNKNLITIFCCDHIVIIEFITFEKSSLLEYGILYIWTNLKVKVTTTRSKVKLRSHHDNAHL